MELDIIYQRVGETRSGKMVPYTNDREKMIQIMEFFQKDGFSIDDLLDAFAIFEYLALRSKRRGDSDVIFDLHSERVFRLMPIDELPAAKERANITSAFQVRDLGKSLAGLEFVDL